MPSSRRKVGGSTQEAQEDIGRFVADKLRDYLATGSSALSGNLPQTRLQGTGSHRLAHLHANTPGVLTTVNSVLAQHNVNIEGQVLATRDLLGYLLTDVGTDYDPMSARPQRYAGDRAPAGAVVTLEADLRVAMGDRHVLADPSVSATCGTDWIRRFTSRARCVVRSADT
jgi:hypothetical protein